MHFVYVTFLSFWLLKNGSEKEERKENLTRSKIVDIYDDAPNIVINFTTQIINQKICTHPYPSHHFFDNDK
jgi:flagellar basal body-associated protein FliL